MPSSLLARRLRIAFGLALVAAGLAHGTGYTPVTALVADVSNDAKAILPALWVGYGWHYVALGLIVLLAGRNARLLWLATLVAVVDGSTHVAYFGYSPSEVMLFGVAAIGAVAAWTQPRTPAVAVA